MSESPVELDTRLDEQSICDEARSEAGLSDFGTDEWIEPMRALLEAFESEGRMNALGRATQRTRAVGLLVNRLRFQDWLSRYPEITEERIEDPIVVAGLPRTGTTMLHRTIGSEPRINALLWFEARRPAPLPDWTPESAATVRDSRIPAAEAEIASMLEANPDLAKVHPFDALAPDEEIMLLEHAFMSGNPPSFVNVPSYMAWLESHDNGPAYAYMKRMLQFLQWQKRQRGDCGERWVLKTPHHLMHLDLLFEQFPKATVVQTHRDVLETIPSFASMNYELQHMASDRADPVEVGTQWANRWEKAMARCLEVRATLSEDRFIDIWYRDALKDPIPQVRLVYERVGMELTADAEEHMLRWADENRRDQRPAHDYSMEQFGFTEADLRVQFADYRRRFIESRQGS